jgi:hypothetical protein
MGEEPAPIARGDGSDLQMSHRRLLVTIAVVVIVGTIAGLIFISSKAGIGVLLGGLLGFGNYAWHRRSMAAVLEGAVRGSATPMLGLRYIFRYIVLGAILTLIYFSQLVSMAGVIFGLMSFVVAVMVEGLTSIFRRTV